MWANGLHRLRTEDAARQGFDSIVDLICGDAEHAAVLATDGRRALKYSELRRFVGETDVGRFGIAAADRIAVCIPNGPEAATAFLSFASRCGYGPLNPQMTAAELSFELEDLPAKAVVVQSGVNNEAVLEAAKALNVSIMELTPDVGVAGRFSLRACRLLNSSDSLPMLIASKRQDTCLLLHTSGTTAKPKVVPLTHENVGVGAQCIASTLKLNNVMVNLNLMPLFHIHGLSINVLASLSSGSSIIATRGFNAQSVFGSWLQSNPAPTWFSAVPTIFQLLLQEHRVRPTPMCLHQLCFLRSESAVLPLSVGEAIEDLFGCYIAQTYAMTESMPIAANPLGPGRKIGSVGPSAGPMITLCDESGKPTIQGQRGEVCVKGACVTRGYELRAHMAIDPNKESFNVQHGLRTGDAGVIDADGHLVLAGRFKEIVNRGGEKISPFQIEHVLRRHPAVRDLIVFAIPHAQLGETVGVGVVLSMPCAPLSLDELCRFAERDLSRKWLPEAMVLLEAIPKGGTGKPLRIGLAAKLGLEAIPCKMGADDQRTTSDDGSSSSALLYGHKNTSSVHDSLALSSHKIPGCLDKGDTFTQSLTAIRGLIGLLILIDHIVNHGSSAPAATASRAPPNAGVTALIIASGFTSTTMLGMEPLWRSIEGRQRLRNWLLSRLDIVVFTAWSTMFMDYLILDVTGRASERESSLNLIDFHLPTSPLDFLGCATFLIYFYDPAMQCPNAAVWTVSALLFSWLLLPLVLLRLTHGVASAANDRGLLVAAAVLQLLQTGVAVPTFHGPLAPFWQFSPPFFLVPFMLGVISGTLALRHKLHASRSLYLRVVGVSCWIMLPATYLFLPMAHERLLSVAATASSGFVAFILYDLSQGGFLARQLGDQTILIAVGQHSFELYLLQGPLWSLFRLLGAKSLSEKLSLQMILFYVLACMTFPVIWAQRIQNPCSLWFRRQRKRLPWASLNHMCAFCSRSWFERVHDRTSLATPSMPVEARTPPTHAGSSELAV